MNEVVTYIDRELFDKVKELIQDHKKVVEFSEGYIDDIARAAQIIRDCIQREGKLMFCGNGGSAADAQHLAAEFVGRFGRERRAYPAIALTTNTSIMTAIGNDYSFDVVFARQIEAIAEKSDVLVAISTSGNSLNVVRAAETAQRIGVKVIGMTGAGGGKLKELCDCCLCVPSSSTPRIQEIHILMGHIICELVEAALC